MGIPGTQNNRMTRPEWSRERLDVLVSGIVASPVHNSHGALEHYSGFSETTDCIRSLSHLRDDFACWNSLCPKSALNSIATRPMQTCCNQEYAPSEMPRIPPVIDAPPSCSFAIIRRPKAENPRAKPSKLIAVDIFSSRFCVFILNGGCRFGCAGGSLLSSRLRQLSKASESPSFRKSAELKRHLYNAYLFRVANFLDPGSVEYSWRRMIPPRA
jgi:hypothetical protein